MRNASLFNPPGNPAPNISVFKELVIQDLQRVHFKKEHQKDIHENVESLCQKKNVIIYTVDKGGGTVLLNKPDYLDEMDNLLLDTETFTIIKRDNTNLYKRQLI